MKIIAFVLTLLTMAWAENLVCNDTRYYINKDIDFEKLENCTEVNGNIFINGENNIDSISSLEHIEKVTGHIVILDSHIINSLKGLQNIKLIEGKDLYLDEYSVVIKHNVNNKNDSHQGLCYA